MKNFKKVLIYSILGVIWSLSNIGYVKYFGSNFALFTLVPYIFLIQKESLKESVYYSIVFGFSAYVVHFWWMIIPIVLVVGGNLLPSYLSFLGLFFGIILVIGVSVFQGTYYALVHLISSSFSKNKKELYYLLFILFGTVLDYFFPKLWCDYLGYSQYSNLYYVQSVDLFGVSFLTLFVLSINSLLAWTIEIFITKNKKNNILFKLLVSFCIFLLIFLPFYGNKRINEINKLLNTSRTIKVGVAQGNNSGLDKKRKEKINDMIYDYNNLTNRFNSENIDLVVWPESSIPYWFFDDKIEFKAVKDNSVKAQLFGTHIMTKTINNNYSIYNSLVLLDKNANKIDSYYKNKLLPFTEEVPYLFDWVFKILNLKEFSKGEGPKILSINGYTFSPNICYEAIKDDYIRRSIFINNQTSNFIVNATNDSWFGNSIEPEMHLVISSFRAIENRRYLVRSTCTGYSAIIDPFGRIINRIDIGKKDISSADIHLLEIRTFYNKIGYLFIYILGFISILCVLIFILVGYYNNLNNEKYYKKVTYKRKMNEIWID